MKASQFVVRTAAAVVLIAVLGCSTAESPDAGREYPNRPIQLIVPFGAGGGTDAFARVIDKAINDHDLLPQPMVVVNVKGAGATIGSRRVKQARPDGYKVLILHDAIITAKLARKAEYGPEAFLPIAGTGQVGMVIAVAEKSPFRTLNDLLQAAKDNPKGIDFGANSGALTHYAGLFLEKESAGTIFNYVHLGGGAERFTQLIGGHIDATGFSVEEFTRYRRKGLRGLAVFDAEPNPAIPDVPTAKSLGINVVLSNTFYWWVPKGTPQKRIDILANALRNAWKTPDVRKRLAEMQIRPVFLEGNELQEHLAESERVYGRVSPKSTAELPNYPVIAASVIGLLVILRLWQIARRSGKQLPASDVKNESPTVTPRTRTAAFIAALTFAYVAILAATGIGFGWTTTAFVAICGIVLLPRKRHNFAILVVLSPVMGFGLEALLVRVFDVYLS